MVLRPTTLGELRASGWVSLPVKEEIRRNAVERIAAGRPLFEGVMGYEYTVMPQLENALLAGHDVIFLGEIGLGGEIRPSGAIERRIAEAARLGFRRVFGSSRSTAQVAGVSMVGLDHVEQFVRALAA